MSPMFAGSLRNAISAAVLTSLAALAPAQESSWVSHGPTDVGWITDIAIADTVAYAATLNGVFRSDDRGATWQPAGLSGLSIIQVAARPGAPAIFALATGVYPSPNLYVSRDSGQTWSSVPGQDSAIAVGIDPEHPSTAYVGTQSDGSIWKSTDAGVTWQQTSISSAPPVSFAFNAGAVFLLTYDNLYKSVDGGVSWAGVAPPAGSPTALAAGAAAGVVYAASGGTFCRTADSGGTWTCSGTAAPFIIRILEVPTVAAPLVIVASFNGVFLSDDGGTTWRPATDDLSSSYSQAVASDATGSLLLAGTDAGVFRSVDRGSTWTPGSAGLRSTWIGGLTLDPQNASTVWAGGLGLFPSGPGLFRSGDAGLSWSAAGGAGGPEGVRALRIDPDHPTTMYAGWSAVFRTDDSGQTWASSSLPEVDQAMNVLALDPVTPQRVWAGAGGLFRSDDGAKTWAPASISQAIFSILIDERHPGTIYAGSYWDVDFSYSQSYDGSIFISHDNGASFTKGSHEFGGAVYAITADPFQDGVLYAGADGVYLSTDGGTTWASAREGLPNPAAFAGLILYSQVVQIVADPVRPGVLYCATLNGVFRTTDGARTWQPFSNGLAPLQTSALVISPDGRRLYAGTAGGGVFELDLQEGPPLPCAASASRLCLVGGRYAVDLIAMQSVPGAWTPGTAHSQSDRAGYFAFPFATGDPDLPEVVVKMLPPGTFGAGGAPVFYSSLTTLPYSLTVTDTHTGKQESYASKAEAPFCGGVDIGLASSNETLLRRAAPKAEGATLSLLGGRFSVSLVARQIAPERTTSGAAMASADRFGFFSLPDVTGDPQFPEVVVKMIDARAFDGNFWFFHTGLTSLDYTLTVTDSATGAVRSYASPTPLCGASDTRAFADSPSVWDY